MTVCNDMSDNTTLDLIAALLWLLTLFNKAQVNSSFLFQILNTIIGFTQWL